METTFGSYYPTDDLGERKLPDNTGYLKEHNIFGPDSAEAVALGQRFRARLEAGETLYLLGFLGTTHNSGLSLVEASAKGGIRVLANHEEERFSEVKHYAGYPGRSAAEMKRMMARMGVEPSRIMGVFYAYDVVREEQSGMRMLLMNGKLIRNKYYRFVTESAAPHVDFSAAEALQMRKNIFSHSPALVAVFRRLAADLGLPAEVPCVQMLHHENHAYFSYGASPFAGEGLRDRTTLISCIDGGGDLSSVSLFKAGGGRIELVKRNTRVNSLGVFYMLCASLLGGWTALSAEGRYMGAAAWGNNDRLTNPYYKRLRQFFHYGENGEVFANSAMADNAFAGLEEIVGPFVAIADIWKPDAVINVDDIRHSPITRDRVDKAAAVQMVFEDALFHILDDAIRKTGADQLVLCGGTALNCVANMRVVDHFDERYYKQYFQTDTRLKIWVPPIPSDQGVVVGAPYQFAMLNGAQPPGALPTPFLCGAAPTRDDIQAALDGTDFVHCEPMGDVASERGRAALADWMAYVVAQDGVVGIFQGQAETGPRALGHRSILSNPCNPETLAVLNSRVKLRERIRPLAPMVTPEEADIWFELSDGAAPGGYDAYDYMVLTARARDCARERIPAVIHYDGTSRLQIVRERNNALVHAYLKALKRHIGVEVSVNTSLNVGTPIVQTAEQAMQVFRRSKGIDCIFMVGDEGRAFMVWAKEGVQAIPSRVAELRRRYLEERGRPAAALDTRRAVLQAFAEKRLSEHDARARLERMLATGS
ncbi:MAG: carbamoyltransferase [Alphaproteobacteria bacterium]|nr:carbamoyltransferase [Alphaproteobacteria bacterium]